jgi:hypothetical protein
MKKKTRKMLKKRRNRARPLMTMIVKKLPTLRWLAEALPTHKR